MKNFKKIVIKEKSGFTLVEIVIVLAIIGVLGAAIISVINPFEIQAIGRDNQRITALMKFSQALELRFADKKNYPPTRDLGGCSGPCVRNIECRELIPYDKSLDIRPTPAWTSSACYVDPKGCYYMYYHDTVKREYKIYTFIESKGFKVPTFSGIELTIETPNAAVAPYSDYPNGSFFSSGCPITSTSRVLILTKKY